MATLLLIVIYVAFVGLGVPDSLFGTAWPAIYAQWGLPVSFATFVNSINSVFSFLSSLVSARVINRLGTYKVALISTALTAVALFGFSVAPSFIWFVLLSIPLGFGGGCIDAALNGYVAIHYSALHMNMLHCSYGIGVTVSPFILSFALAGPGGWRGGYRAVVLLQLIITVIVAASLPLWRKQSGGNSLVEPESRDVPFRELVRTKGVPATWVLFFSACAIESTCGQWGSTFLVEAKGFGADVAAGFVSLYYLGLALGRFFSGILSLRLSAGRLVVLGECIVGTAIILLILPLGSVVAAAGLFLAGFGIGPIYPNLIHMTPYRFGIEAARSIMGTQAACASLGFMTMPALFGLVAQLIDPAMLPYFVLCLFLILATVTAASKTARLKRD
ncbi:MAG: MFS transporter [Clostridia bacterium]|nr:MFS transporter [Clostridia bacterium]